MNTILNLVYYKYSLLDYLLPCQILSNKVFISVSSLLLNFFLIIQKLKKYKFLMNFFCMKVTIKKKYLLEQKIKIKSKIKLNVLKFVDKYTIPLIKD